MPCTFSNSTCKHKQTHMQHAACCYIVLFKDQDQLPHVRKLAASSNARTAFCHVPLDEVAALAIWPHCSSSSPLNTADSVCMIHSSAAVQPLGCTTCPYAAAGFAWWSPLTRRQFWNASCNDGCCSLLPCRISPLHGGRVNHTRMLSCKPQTTN